MKASITKSGLLALAMLSAGFAAGAKELTKEVRQTFKATSSSELFIENKFGKVVVEPGDPGQVVFEINIRVEHSDADKAQQLLDRISIDFKTEGSSIWAKTIFDTKQTRTTGVSKQKIDIDYLVKVPAGIALNIDHNFGDVILGNLDGKLGLELNYGQLSAGRLSNSANRLEINYSSGTIAFLSGGELELNYVGDINIREAGKLTIGLNYGSGKLGKVEELSLEANYSSFTVENVSGKGPVDIEVNMGSIDLGISTGFKLTGEMSMGDIQLPKGMTDVVRNKKTTSLEVSGTFGDGRTAISVEGNMSSVDVKTVK